MSTANQISDVAFTKCKTQVILVTYDFYQGAVDRVKALLNAAEDCTITVIDNSCSEYKRRHHTKAILQSLADDIVYIDHQINNRFAAYNLGLNLCKSEYVIFRTDDDVFDEITAFSAIRDGFVEEFAIFPYLHDQRYHAQCDFRRPIESVIFKRSFLSQFLPFSHRGCADRFLLEEAFAASTPVHNPKILFEKARRGRPVATVNG